MADIYDYLDRNLYAIGEVTVEEDGTKIVKKAEVNAQAPTVPIVNPANIVTGDMAGDLSIVGGFLQSKNFVRNTIGWRLSADGTLEAVGVVLSGSITATSGYIAGFTIAAGSITSTGMALVSGSTAYLAFGATPPTGPATGTGIYIDKTGLFGLSANTQNFKIDATNGNITAIAGTIGGCALSATSIGSTLFTSGPLGSGWNISNTGIAEFQNITLRGTIRTSVFEKDTISATNGIFLISKADVLSGDMTALDSSTVTISGQTSFVNNEVIRIKDGTDDEWMLVTDASSAPTYVVIRDLASAYSANTNPIWKKGTAIVSLGVGTGTKTGFISMDSTSTNSPFIDVYGRNSNTYSDYSLHTRIGWLKGITDADVGLATTDVWGLYCDNAYIKGTIVSSSGKIGGFEIGADYIRDVANTFGLSSSTATPSEILLDSCTETDTVSEYSVGNDADTTTCVGQIVIPTVSANITKLKFNLYKTDSGGAPTGNIYARVYIADPYNYTPPLWAPSSDGDAPPHFIATSDPISITTLSTVTPALITFTFSGAEQILLTGGQKYGISVEYDATSSNLLVPYHDADVHPGNMAVGWPDNMNWNAWPEDWGNTVADLPFYLYGIPNSDIRFWSGDTFANRDTAPFNIDIDGNVTAEVITNKSIQFANIATPTAIDGKLWCNDNLAGQKVLWGYFGGDTTNRQQISMGRMQTSTSFSKSAAATITVGTWFKPRMIIFNGWTSNSTAKKIGITNGQAGLVTTTSGYSNSILLTYATLSNYTSDLAVTGGHVTSWTANTLTAFTAGAVAAATDAIGTSSGSKEAYVYVDSWNDSGAVLKVVCAANWTIAGSLTVIG